MLAPLLNKTIIQRNIIQVARCEMQSLIDEYGDVKAAELIRVVFQEELSKLTPEEYSSIRCVFLEIHFPEKTLLKVNSLEILLRKEHLTSLFKLTMLKELQILYQSMLSNQCETSIVKLQWIPKWTQTQATEIKEKLIYQPPKPTGSYVLVTMTFLSLCIVIHAKTKDESAAKNKIFFMLFIVYIASILGIALSRCLDTQILTPFFEKKARADDQRRLGEVHIELCALVDEVEKKTFHATVVHPKH